MQNVCRTCMGDSVTLVNIFSDVRDPALEQPVRNLSYILSECTNRSVRRDDCQPQFICLSCVQTAQTAFRFKRQCDRSYHRFCELQNKDSLEGDQDEDNQQAISPESGHKEAPKADDSRSDLSPGATNNTPMLRSPVGTGRTKNRNNRFACVHCNNTYKRRWGLRRHLLTHTTKPTHNCPYCPKFFWRKDCYTDHLRTHGKRRPVSCNKCAMVCPDATYLEMHQQEHNEEMVGNKSPVLEADNIINKENRSDVIAENVPVLETDHKHFCDLCSDSFVLEEDLKTHRTLVHDINITNTAKSMTITRELEPQRLNLSLESSALQDCNMENSQNISALKQAESGFDQENISPSSFLRNQSKLLNPEAKSFQFSEPKHHCPICSKAFFLRYMLMQHLRTHDDWVPHACRQCSAIFIERNQLKIHQREHEENTVGATELEDPDWEDKDVDTEDNNMINDISDTNPVAESTPVLRDWEIESLNLSLESNTIDDSGIQRSEDTPTLMQNESGFDQETTSAEQSEKPKKLSEKKSDVCPFCHSKQNKSNMRRHLKTHISKPEHKCSVCLKLFARSDNLTRHLARVHAEHVP
ncbi:zinc finger protein Paris isoform X2 [Drosophila kikkawai]|uniref:Zinc finger protein Paris isoform X2 n=1 Tax=Drosophila kikkawai TaxID=30033 RepID=A0ABM4GKV7_DROKI